MAFKGIDMNTSSNEESYFIYQMSFGDYVYIGRTKNIKKRIREHRCQLKTGRSPFSGVCADFGQINHSVEFSVPKSIYGVYEMSLIQYHKAMGHIVLNGNDGDFSKNKGKRPTGMRSVLQSERMKIVGASMRKKQYEDFLKTKSYVVVYDGNEEIFKSKVVKEVADFLGVNFSSVFRYLRGERNHKKYKIAEVDIVCI